MLIGYFFLLWLLTPRYLVPKCLAPSYQTFGCLSLEYTIYVTIGIGDCRAKYVLCVVSWVCASILFDVPNLTTKYSILILFITAIKRYVNKNSALDCRYVFHLSMKLKYTSFCDYLSYLVFDVKGVSIIPTPFSITYYILQKYNTYQEL